MENKKSIDVSFIIIEYHSINDVMKCVNSIQEKCFNINYEIIISSNSTYEIAKQRSLELKYPKMRWSFNNQNNGFAYGMNCGISIAKGEFIILQNPDTLILNDHLFSALELLKKDKTIGLIGPKIINSKKEVQDSCREFLLPSKLIIRTLKRKLFKKTSILDVAFDYTQTQSVNWVIGAFMIFSRESINQVGLLNEKFFMYVEDMDLCLRFWDKGLKVIYYPLLLIKYEGDRKSTSINILKINKYTLMHIKNYISFIKQHGLNKIKKLSVLAH